jgi:hypothetical protein
MRVGTWYVVTKASECETFLVGDHIKLTENGSILCKEASGWIDAEDVSDATKGMEYVIDEEWKKNKIQKLKDELAKLEAA